jgi:spore maturation protein CgeB
MAKDPSAGRFLSPKLRGKVIRLRVFIMRYLRFLGVSPYNLVRFFQLNQPRHDLPPLTSMDALKNYKIACILDEFSFESFRHEAQFEQISAANPIQDLEKIQPHMILIESAWKGKGDQWSRKISNISNEVIEVIAWARKNKIPTVFFHKEVPPHFETFMYVSKMFDHIFLTDAACIKPYRERVGHDRVHFMAFAAQPKVHSPISVQKRFNAMIYAGSFYPEYKYPERYRNFMDIYDAVSPHIRIDIYDRNAGKGIYEFPEKFHKNIVGSLPYSQMNEAYKKYEYGLNMNSVKESNSMCSRRLFELIMSNIFVIGNFSKAVKNYFGDLTISSDSKQEILEEFQKLNLDPQFRDQVKLQAMRKVLSEHTYGHRIKQMMSVFDNVVHFKDPSVLVIGVGTNFTKLRENFDHQAYPNKHFMLAEQNLMGELTKYDYVAVMSDDSFYGNHYLTDLVHGFEYADADVIAVSKEAYYVAGDPMKLENPGTEYRYISSFEPTRSVIKSDSALTLLTNGKLDQACNGKALSNDRFNYFKSGSQAIRSEDIAYVTDAPLKDMGKSLEQIVALDLNR